MRVPSIHSSIVLPNLGATAKSMGKRLSLQSAYATNSEIAQNQRLLTVGDLRVTGPAAITQLSLIRFQCLEFLFHNGLHHLQRVIGRDVARSGPWKNEVEDVRLNTGV